VTGGEDMTSNVDVAFPVAVFWPMPGKEKDDFFSISMNRTSFDRALREELGVGKCERHFVDNDGRAWAVREIKDLGRITPFWLALLQTLLFQGGEVEHRAEYVLEDRGLTPFSQVQEKIIRLMAENPDSWVDVHESDGDRVTEETLLAPYKAKIMASTNLEQMVTGLEDFFAE
jgi:hypothetical protein